MMTTYDNVDDNDANNYHRGRPSRTTITATTVINTPPGDDEDSDSLLEVGSFYFKLIIYY